MNVQYPLTVYYDASCALCSTEIQNIKIHDSGQHLQLVDCSAPGFDDTPYRPDGVTRQMMMACLHVRTGNGEWVKGVPAFELLYRTAGMPLLANLWGGKFTRPVFERIYPWVARHRRAISWTGLPLLFMLWGKCEARRASGRSRQCHDGKCSI